MTGDDYPTELPVDISDGVLMTVEDSSRFPLYGEQAKKDWDSTAPKGVGYARLGANNRILCTSFGHQMHCLRTLRVALDNPNHPFAMFGHAQHCMNYLRQMTLCDADLTLEPFDPLQRNFTAEPLGAIHECKDWNKVYVELNGNWDDWLKYLHAQP